MKLTEKINMDYMQLLENGPINIVALGDSVTHGAFAWGEVDQEAAYWNLLKGKILGIRNYVPVNAINAGIGGSTAKDAVKRFENQVLCHVPDVLIICFGLNDVNGELDEYIDSLGILFEKSKNANIETIFMTPNMLNTYVAEDTEKSLKEYAAKTAQMQNEGRMDKYIYAAIALARKMDIKVCDCYSKWKELNTIQDTTLLLANRINHPTREMHELFAQSLFEIIFPQKENLSVHDESTMYKG